MNIKLALLVCIIIFPCSPLATEYRRSNVTVKSLHPLSAARVNDPGLANYTRVYFNKAPWGVSSCREDAADLHKDDTHVLSILLTGWTTGKQIHALVDDSLPNTQSNVCRLVGIFVE